uniref:Uncharacterized protein n=1 Tax=Timema genevievae TaxID=629358 RepID=A0A7R9PKK4_TIMGE|nr:unnamed protein product [Timema genevievae]
MPIRRFSFVAQLSSFRTLSRALLLDIIDALADDKNDMKMCQDLSCTSIELWSLWFFFGIWCDDKRQPLKSLVKESLQKFKNALEDLRAPASPQYHIFAAEKVASPKRVLVLDTIISEADAEKDQTEISVCYKMELEHDQDADTASKAVCFSFEITQGDFLVALELVHCFSYTLQLRKNLQSPNQDILSAVSNISNPSLDPHLLVGTSPPSPPPEEILTTLLQGSYGLESTAIRVKTSEAKTTSISCLTDITKPMELNNNLQDWKATSRPKSMRRLDTSRRAPTAEVASGQVKS